MVNLKPTWLFGSMRYRTTIGTKYLEKAAGKLGRLSCKNMAILGTCSISSARTVGSEYKHYIIRLINTSVHYSATRFMYLQPCREQNLQQFKYV